MSIPPLTVQQEAASNVDSWLEFSATEKQEVMRLTEQLALSEGQKAQIRLNCWEALSDYHVRSYTFYRAYIRLKFVNIIFSATTPLLAGLGAITKSEPFLWISFGISLVAAVSAGVLQFTKYGERWNNYRNAAQKQKSIGWHFLLLTGPFKSHSTHAEAYNDFIQRLEEIASAATEGNNRIAAEPGVSNS